jgi:hypothetical protein
MCINVVDYKLNILLLNILIRLSIVILKRFIFDENSAVFPGVKTLFTRSGHHDIYTNFYKKFVYVCGYVFRLLTV